jgi:hypothetical protein
MYRFLHGLLPGNYMRELMSGRLRAGALVEDAA